MSTTFIVHVSAAHIANNVPQSTSHCAIAKAVREQFPELGEPNIGCWTAYIGTGKYVMSGNVPEFLYRNSEYHANRAPAPDPIDVEFTES